MSVESMIGDATGKVQRMSSSKDVAGGIVPDWDDIYADVPMRAEATGSRYEERAGKRLKVTNYVVYTQQSGIEVGMRIVFTPDDGSDSLTMLVQGESPRFARSLAIPTWYEIICEHTAEMTPL